ncbi:hypothetical protein FHG87_004699 [Trinorchestia longiramus]|nr:hypothetical protein FHG87_004699 [Trinorchestia longiramus]
MGEFNGYFNPLGRVLASSAAGAGSAGAGAGSVGAGAGSAGAGASSVGAGAGSAGAGSAGAGAGAGSAGAGAGAGSAGAGSTSVGSASAGSTSAGSANTGSTSAGSASTGSTSVGSASAGAGSVAVGVIGRMLLSATDVAMFVAGVSIKCSASAKHQLGRLVHQLGRLVNESAFEREDLGSNPAADMVDAARNTAWDLGKQPNNYRSNHPTQEWARSVVLLVTVWCSSVVILAVCCAECGAAGDGVVQQRGDLAVQLVHDHYSVQCHCAETLPA